MLNYIGQTTNDFVEDISKNQKFRKINEKEESLNNTRRHVYNVSVVNIEDYFGTKATDEIENVDDFAEEVVEETPAVKTVASIQPDYLFEDDGKNYAIVPNKSFSLGVGKSEMPIAVKEKMFVNISKHSLGDKKEELTYEESLSEVNREFHELDGYLDEEPEVDDKSDVAGILPKNIEDILKRTDDFDSTIVELSQTREMILNLNEQVNEAKKAAADSEKLLERVSDEYSHAEEQLKESESRSRAMEEKILNILAHEKDKLNKQLQEHENIINTANKQKEENAAKINDYKSKITSTAEKTNAVNEKINRQEELLSALNEYASVDMYGDDENSNGMRRAA